MFAKTIIDSDAFLDMPVTARLLYYDLAMRADDDGFVNSPKKIMRMIGASQDDLGVLVMRKFIIPFDNGVVVIKHWRIHNYIRRDTYNETPYKEQKELLELDENNAYRMIKQDTSTNRQLPVDDTLTQDRIGKDIDRIDKVSIEREGALPRSHTFTPPSFEEVEAYCQERNNGIDAQTFIDYYSARGWMMNSKNKMKDWKAAVRTWEQRHKEEQKAVQSKKKYVTNAEYVAPKPTSMEALRAIVDMI